MKIFCIDECTVDAGIAKASLEAQRAEAGYGRVGHPRQRRVC
jgi:hypothetical protein